MAFSQMDVVASLGVLLRWSRPRCASLWLRIQNVKRELCTRVAPFDEEPGSALKRNRLCAGHAQQCGGESPLPNLMEVKG
jgi:hypothetical protein